MTKTTALLFSTMLPLLMTGQDNLDNIWLFGYGFDNSPPFYFGRTFIDFNTSPPNIYKDSDWNGTSFQEFNASICNEEGELQFYTNGLTIINKEHGGMENGGEINPGQFHDDMLNIGYILWQGGFVVPDPGNEDRYYLFHADREYSTPEVPGHSPHLYYSLIDMSENNGLGKVLEKNMTIINDTLSLGKLTGVRHANGRDWWILFHEYAANKYYQILVSPSGVENLGKKTEGSGIPREGIGQSVFSPDGRFFARLNTFSLDEGHYLDIYEFDRCSGLLAEQIQINFSDSAYSSGLAISPNSRYLYVSSFTNIYQYDLHAADIEASGEKVAEYDGFFDGQSSTTFYLAQLAPDGKIYINVPGGVQYLHVIHNPDEPCPGCGIEQHGIYLPTHNAASLPNFPKYRLGPLDGSPCDSLGLDNVPVAKFRYEQDTMDYLKVEFTDLSYYEPAEWHWDFGDNATSSSKNTSRQYASEGVYEVCLTVSNDNGEDTFCQTLQLGTVATGETGKEIGITVFPNPAKEGVNVIVSDGYLPRDGKIILYNGMGQACLSQPVRSGWNNVQLGGLAPGIYFYEVRDGEALLGSGKLVVDE